MAMFITTAFDQSGLLYTMSSAPPAAHLQLCQEHAQAREALPSPISTNPFKTIIFFSVTGTWMPNLGRLPISIRGRPTHLDKQQNPAFSWSTIRRNTFFFSCSTTICDKMLCYKEKKDFAGSSMLPRTSFSAQRPRVNTPFPWGELSPAVE